MTKTTKKLLIMLLGAIVIFILAWIYRPFEPDETQTFEGQFQNIEIQNNN